jgi:hypothetical protein
MEKKSIAFSVAVTMSVKLPLIINGARSIYMLSEKMIKKVK